MSTFKVGDWVTLRHTGATVQILDELQLRMINMIADMGGSPKPASESDIAKAKAEQGL